MATLLDISKELLALNDALDALDGDTTQQADELQAWFDELLSQTIEQRDRKLDNYAALISELEARAAARKAEAARLADRARIDANRAASLKLMLQDFFAVHDIKTIETARYRLTLAGNGGKLPVVLAEWVGYSDIPDELCHVKREPDMTAIRAKLEAGESLPFARLGERGQSMRIK